MDNSPLLQSDYAALFYRVSDILSAGLYLDNGAFHLHLVE